MNDDLDNSRLLDVHKWSDYPGLLEITKKLFSTLYLKGDPDWDNGYYRTLRVVLTDLFDLHHKDLYAWIAFHKNNNAFQKLGRYNKIHITRTYLNGVIDVLERLKYIEIVPGFNDRREGGSSRLSRMRPTSKLIALFDEIATPEQPVFSRSDCEELLIMRDDKKADIEYDDDIVTDRMRMILNNYNKLLHKAFIDLDMTGYDGDYEMDRYRSTLKITHKNKFDKKGNPLITKIDMNNRRVRRVFNDSSWEHGGRFFGGWWQSLPRGLRNRIVIGKHLRETVEIDFRAIHIVLLYAMKGIRRYSIVDSGQDWDDPYSLPGFGSDEDERDQFRNLFKLIMLVMLNAGNRTKAVQAIKKKIRDFNNNEIALYPPNAKECVTAAIDALVERHSAISEYFFTGKGKELQKLDSEIAESVIRLMTDGGRPVLCIHDSFVCNYADFYEISGYMNLAISQHMPGDYGYEVEEYDCFKPKYQYDKSEEDYKNYFINSSDYILDKISIL